MPRELTALAVGVGVGLLLGLILGRWLVVPKPAPLAEPEAAAAEIPESATTDPVGLVFDGRIVELSPLALRRIQDLLRAKQKAEAIQVFSEATGLEPDKAGAVIDFLPKVAC
ncbi:hypothetical protein [Methylomagnum ishizawai]|nr:hypothetical protein [Methylomagnum ishizawai]